MQYTECWRPFLSFLELLYESNIGWYLADFFEQVKTRVFNFNRSN